MIEFIEETHQYLVNGILVPSVTQMLGTVFPNKYDGVDESILNEKAKYGTKVHKCIELIEKKKLKRPISYCKRYLDIDIYQEESIRQYLQIKKDYDIQVLESEKIVQYNGLYGGCMDMKALVKNKKAIVDIKTTYELDKEYVSWQDSFYELADEPVEELYVLWLPKGHLGGLYKVNRIDKEILLEVVYQFRKDN